MEQTIVYKHKVCAAHRLTNHKGKCRSLHGHNYIISLHIRSETDDPDMVVDFAYAKEHHGAQLDAWFDHKTILWRLDPLREQLVNLLGPTNVHVMENPPTAENMAKYILGYMINIENTVLFKVKVEETPGCSATASL